MSIEAIQPVSTEAAAAAFLEPVQAPGGVPVAANFGDMVSNGMQQVNQALLEGEKDLRQLATGDVQNLHQIMIRVEENRVQFQLAMQIRGRLLEGYQDIMRMQV